jgi:hypothetical protein
MSDSEKTRRQTQSIDAKQRFGTERDLSAITGIPIRTFQKHRLYGNGLPYYRYEGRNLYDLNECVEIISASRTGAAA